MSRLATDFYQRTDVEQVAKELLGTFLCTHFDDQLTIGKIVETEAYRGPDDKACHAYNHRRTKRTEVMYWHGGHAYVYLIYGIHHLFNVVTAGIDQAHAVLIRAVEPIEGIPTMLERRGQSQLLPKLTAGPGTLSKALGISTLYTGQNMLLPDSPIWLEQGESPIEEQDIIASPRVGIGYAEEWVEVPWRFRIRGSKWTSRAK